MSLLSLPYRYLRTRRIALVAVFFIAVGVMSMIVVTGLMSGVQVFLRSHFKGTEADIRVEHVMAGSGLLQHWETVRGVLDEERVERGGEIVALSPRMAVPALVVGGRNPSPSEDGQFGGIRLIGIDWQDEQRVTPFRELFDRVDDEILRVPAERQEDPFQRRDDIPGIILGDSLARDLGVSHIHRDGCVTLMTGDVTRTKGATGVDNQRSQVFRVVGCYSTGREDFDRLFAYVDRGTLRLLRFDRPDRHPDASSVHLRLKNPDRAEEAARALMSRHPDLICESWQSANRADLGAIDDQKRIMMFILFFIILVAAAAICGIVYLMVVEKTKDIGILRSMGLSRWRLVSVFTIYGFFLGAIGVGVGLFLGLQVAEHLDAVVRWLSEVTGVELLNPEIYRFKEIPVHLEAETVATIGIATLATSVVAAFVPAVFKAGLLTPVMCLRAD